MCPAPSAPRSLCFLLCIPLATIVGGCDDDTSTSPSPDRGTIVVDPEPDAIDAPWVLTGPDSSRVTGTGDDIVRDLVAGDYTLTWGEVVGWILPAPPVRTETLAPEVSVTFTGTYAAQSQSIVIDVEPDPLEAPWALDGPDGDRIVGAGDTTLTDVRAGTYSITWLAADDPIYELRPDPAVVTGDLDWGATLEFRGKYSFPTTPGFAAIDAGSFDMGSPPEELGREAGETVHRVTLTTAFEMQSTEVTNAQYAELAQWAVDNGHATVSGGSLLDALDGSTVELLDLDDGDCEIALEGGELVAEAGKESHPVVELSWYGAVAYCDWASLRAGLPRAHDHATWTLTAATPAGARGFRLPTEAEWEYASRAGAATAFANGPITDAGCSDPGLFAVAWYCGNANGSSQGVGQKQPNAWGLHDTHGNVWEWCADWIASYDGDATDPAGPETGQARVIRGGSWRSNARTCRSAQRESIDPESSNFVIGFRPVRSID
jgi:formylglycine-generating enzyme required for sulfatase activity